MTKNKHAIEYLIASTDPFFLDKGVIWFSENREKIKSQATTNSWWQDNCFFFEKDFSINLSEFLRKISDMGYEKVQTVALPGEFASRGGIIDVFPTNSLQALRLEFFGNKIENILPLGEEVDDDLRLKILNKKVKAQEKSIEESKKFKEGDFVVHLDHGIGIFRGFFFEKSAPTSDLCHSRSLPCHSHPLPCHSHPLPCHSRENGNPDPELNLDPRIRGDDKEDYGEALVLDTGDDNSIHSTIQDNSKFFIIEYAAPKHGQNPDRLFVPVEQAKKLSLYIGFETPTVHRLGSEIWIKTKHKIKEDAEKFARELIDIYAKREIAARPPYHPDDQMQRDFESQFKHFETEDQLKAIEDIKKDMALSEPMDRLICGDVGFGKTEVALRAAFKAVMSGRQVALLCPTTILADQHYETFSDRLKDFPVKVALMSRMESKQDQQKTAKELADGNIDIVIGTHRLLSGDIHFKNLGLLIIDEEQRFGVKQKEKFKHLREEVDILSLSATPIPRTMYLALSGMRKISTIQTPPPGRRAVETFVMPYSDEIIKKAIQEELKRHGQIFFLYNRVQTIQSEQVRLGKLFPDLKIAIAHGRMSEGQLRKIIHDFRLPAGRHGDKQYDLLLATTIIENGLDLPNANTLIVANATRLGLAQSYQIRGRIGRSDKTAHAYFLYNEKELKDTAKERLEVLEEATELGDGWKIAQKDLEIRGAGNILGRAQSGSLNKVGLNLYCQILSEAVERLRK